LLTSQALTTSSGFHPRFGANGMLYIAATGSGESLWQLAQGAATELWRGPAAAADGRSVAFSVREGGLSHFYVIGADGANPRILTDSLDLQGDRARYWNASRTAPKWCWSNWRKH
jgi:hypothetical protein